eukprot:m.250279 g.250279  ORF g.250279 m.250279 type:complete len:109 (-) comp54506_c0_seq6:1526-1852(-)
MAQDAAMLQAYNVEVVKCIEDLQSKRELLQRAIVDEEHEKLKIQQDLHVLTERLARISESLARKLATRAEYDRTIHETEAAYAKIVESSHTLLQVLKRGVPSDEAFKK